MDSEIMKSCHHHANHKDRFMQEVFQWMNFANQNDYSLCHNWHQWEYFDPENHIEDNKMQVACVGIMFDNIKQWNVVNGNKKKSIQETRETHKWTLSPIL